MELLAPSPFLIIWQLGVLLSIVLFLTSWGIILFSKTMSSSGKTTWLLATLVLPIVASLIFLFKFRTLSKARQS